MKVLIVTAELLLNTQHDSCLKVVLCSPQALTSKHLPTSYEWLEKSIQMSGKEISKCFTVYWQLTHGTHKYGCLPPIFLPFRYGRLCEWVLYKMTQHDSCLKLVLCSPQALTLKHLHTGLVLLVRVNSYQNWMARKFQNIINLCIFSQATAIPWKPY